MIHSRTIIQNKPSSKFLTPITKKTKSKLKKTKSSLKQIRAQVQILVISILSQERRIKLSNGFLIKKGLIQLIRILRVHLWKGDSLKAKDSPAIPYDTLRRWEAWGAHTASQAIFLKLTNNSTCLKIIQRQLLQASLNRPLHKNQ